MEIILYKFSKKKNSTLQPTAGGVVASVYLKENTSIKSPTFVYNGNNPLSYNYVKAFDRFYFVTDIISLASNLYEITCSTDVLATFKSQIQAATSYVRYSASSYNVRIPDTRLSTVDTCTIKTSQSSEGLPDYSREDGVGSVGLQVINDRTSVATGNGLGFYFVNSEAMSTITALLMNNESMMDKLAKYFGDAYKAIISVKWIPFIIGLSEENSETVQLGNIPLEGILDPENNPDHGVRIVGLRPTSTTICMVSAGWSLEIPWEYDDWRNMSPYTKITVYLPYVGMVDIPVNDYIGKDHVEFITVVDKITGDITYQRIISGAIADVYKSNLAVELQIGQSQADVRGKIGAVGSFVSSLSNLNPLGVVSAVTDSIIADNSRTLSTAGSALGGVTTSQKANNYGIAVLYLYTHNTNVEPSSIASSMGRPLHATRSLSGLSGYTECVNASVNIQGYGSDKDEVNSYLNSGFFIE